MGFKNNDFTVDDEGSICVLNAETPAAIAWADENLPEDRQTWGVNGTVVEPRYLGDIITGIRSADLTVGDAS